MCRLVIEEQAVPEVRSACPRHRANVTLWNNLSLKERVFEKCFLA
jgi:hypothetical protein